MKANSKKSKLFLAFCVEYAKTNPKAKFSEAIKEFNIAYSKLIQEWHL